MIGRLRNAIIKRRTAADFVRLYSGECTERQTARIKNRRVNSKQYQDQFQGAMQVMAGLEALAGDPAILAAVENPPRVSLATKAWDQWPRLAAAAVLVLAAGLGLNQLYRWGAAEDRTNIQLYVTRLGEQKTINLPDGSEVTLNTMTQLLVDFSKGAVSEGAPKVRRVILEHGEAYFTIAPDPSRPFTVELGDRSVSVLGTQFTIRRSPEKFSLAVVEGTVAIHRQGEPASATAPELSVLKGEEVRLKTASQRRLQAGMVVEFDVEQQTMTAYQAPNINRLSSWRTGIIRFEYEPLYKVVQELNRYMSKKILIEDDAVMNLKIYATVRLDNLNAALVGLENTLPIKIIRHIDRTVIIGDASRSLE